VPGDGAAATFDDFEAAPLAVFLVAGAAADAMAAGDFLA
jgi:hypothetical protein